MPQKKYLRFAVDVAKMDCLIAKFESKGIETQVEKEKFRHYNGNIEAIFKVQILQ